MNFSYRSFRIRLSKIMGDEFEVAKNIRARYLQVFLIGRWRQRTLQSVFGAPDFGFNFGVAILGRFSYSLFRSHGAPSDCSHRDSSCIPNILVAERVAGGVRRSGDHGTWRS
jgi:hypothetical protein